MVSNFRTYEAQSRLLAAVIASHPGLKLNFKAITLHFGSDVTESVIRHRFRPVKMQAEAIRKAVAQGQDAKELSGIFYVNEKGTRASGLNLSDCIPVPCTLSSRPPPSGLSLTSTEIAKYFGESTPQGIEFQFRSIRKDAKALRDAVDKGESPLTVRKTAPTASRKSTAASSLKRRTSPATGATDAAARPTKRTNTVAAVAKLRNDPVFSNGEDSSSLGDDVDYEQLDLTPTATPTPTSRSLPAAFLPASQLPVSSPAPPMTPTSATAALTSAASSFVPDLTPAVSSGSTPSENDTPVADIKYISGVRQHQQQQAGGRFYAGNNTTGPNGRTVLKVPKTETVAASAAAVIASTSDFDSWQSFGPSVSHSNPTDSFQLFNVGTSSWAQDDVFSSSTSQSFSQSMSQSFYESEGAI
ncbi:hypothetical protein CMQ_6141 [Grosmannia clavigera kw1407]|uniref:Uncharacterized protein n=1 Tax=Grosmannia clavigera (strain kw1407 / UAMH 11150) TaxID=655863 RepID=F0XLK6_GROCL|nr:uncharacterized protein CMQ_6141 [Grosmannia clavigera kw1407]EFX01199.1 hypothetical protein CMQ_6141 [Grosmannia clavigera kw1407]